MNMIRHYQPLSNYNPFVDEINRLFTGIPKYQYSEKENVAYSDWVPTVDIKEEDKNYLISADIPGVDLKDIEISVDNGTLIVKGERSNETKEEKDRYKRIERVYGSFFRRFTLPDNINTDNITANAKNGVLDIVIPKQEKAQPKRISVQS